MFKNPKISQIPTLNEWKGAFLAVDNPKTFLFSKKLTYEAPPANSKIVKNSTVKSIFPYKIIWQKFLNINSSFDPQNKMFEKTSVNKTWSTQKVVYQKYPQKVKKSLGGKVQGAENPKNLVMGPLNFSDFLRVLLVNNFLSRHIFKFWNLSSIFYPKTFFLKIIQ